MILNPYMHLGFNCKDLEKSVKFYQKAFGCTEKFSLYYGDMIPENPVHRETMDQDFLKYLESIKDVKWIVYLEWKDGIFIELFNELTATEPHIPEQQRDLNFTHFSILTDNIWEMYEQMIDNGLEEYIDLTPRPNVDRTYAFWFHDPDGNKAEVIQYTDYSMQKIGREAALTKEAKVYFEKIMSDWMLTQRQ